MKKGTFKLHCEYSASGDQPQAIESLVEGLENSAVDKYLKKTQR